MAFLDYIMEAANALAQEMMSLTLDFFTNLVQWCASASYSFWDASLVNVLLQAGAGVSILVWAVSFPISKRRNRSYLTVRYNRQVRIYEKQHARRPDDIISGAAERLVFRFWRTEF